MSILRQVESDHPVNRSRRAVVCLSGGQDSVTVLALAVRWFGPGNVYTVAFDYGQRHAVELQCARHASQSFDAADHIVVDVSGPLQIADSALTGRGDVSQEHPFLKGRPASFVPNRNAMLLTAAHAMAQQIGASYVLTGANATDYSGYPDCRPEFLDALRTALTLGSEQDIEFVSPLLNLTKGETFRLAHEMLVLRFIVNHTHTCYNGDRTTGHLWGRGCGTCPACVLRAKGWHDFVAWHNDASNPNPIIPELS